MIAPLLCDMCGQNYPSVDIKVTATMLEFVLI